MLKINLTFTKEEITEFLMKKGYKFINNDMVENVAGQRFDYGDVFNKLIKENLLK